MATDEVFIALVGQVALDIDDVLRSTDVTVHIIVLALLIAFASLLWYAYGA